jgi:hypothetical protein
MRIYFVVNQCRIGLENESWNLTSCVYWKKPAKWFTNNNSHNSWKWRLYCSVLGCWLDLLL